MRIVQAVPLCAYLFQAVPVCLCVHVYACVCMFVHGSGIMRHARKRYYGVTCPVIWGRSLTSREVRVGLMTFSAARNWKLL